MNDRPDGCYRWVQIVEDAMPEIAMWEGPGWAFPGDDALLPRVHKVGVGGTLDAPPAEWVDDLPEGGT